MEDKKQTLGVVFSSISHSFFILFGFLFVLRQGIWWLSYYFMGFPDGSVVKNPPANAGDMGSIPGSGRSPGEGNGNQLQYSCLRNPMDKGAWQATVHSVEESDTTEATQHACIRSSTQISE